jgi:1-aminocyclopropane-1-carboxylate deaminase/D-cysteine desulfhydrase-like pyridoxal-dependent ACC family enzyme
MLAGDERGGGATVAHRGKGIRTEVESQVTRLADLTGLRTGRSDEINIDDGTFVAPYGMPTREGSEASALALHTEGILLDNTYTAKAFAALLRHDSVKRDLPVVFWHTGRMVQAANELFGTDRAEPERA